jgi:hypothetical protein
MTDKSWNSLEEEFIYYAQIWEWAKLFNVIAPKTKVIKEVDIFSAIEGIGLGLLVKGDAYKFLLTITGKTGEEASEWLKNEIRCFNAQRTAHAIAKCYKTLKDSGIEAKEVPQKLLVPILENISIEDEEILQEMWINLLTSAISGNNNKRYVEKLKLLDSLDANILEVLYEWRLVNSEQYLTGIGIGQLLIRKNYHTENNKIEESIAHLIDTGFCQKGNLIAGIIKEINMQEEALDLTITGLNFMKAVNK